MRRNASRDKEFTAHKEIQAGDVHILTKAAPNSVSLDNLQHSSDNQPSRLIEAGLTRSSAKTETAG